MTFAIVSPDHKLINEIIEISQNKNEIKKYIEISKKKTDFERLSTSKEKSGVDTGLKIINPINGKELSFVDS